MLIKEKVNQAIGILGEYGIDCWITFVRESGMMRDPMLDFLCAADMTWHSAFIISRTGKSCAIVGQMEKLTVEEMGVYDQVFGYVEGVKGDLLAYLKELDPKTIAVNYSETSEVCDGLTHGMYLTLKSHLADIGFDERLISAERVTSSLRARKTPSEIKPMRTAVENTLEIYAMLADFIRPGLTEKEIAAFTQAEIRSRGLGYAWDPFHCPAVFTGPESAGAHYQPTDRVVERGHLLNMDFGVNFEDYVSDIQRTFYILREGETGAPAEVMHGFETIVTSIELARQALVPARSTLSPATISFHKATRAFRTDWATRWAVSLTMGQHCLVRRGRNMPISRSRPLRKTWCLPSNPG
jgi:Xaa-Pro aminopeptidase